MVALALSHARLTKTAEEQLMQYHAFTVHSIRNELIPVEVAEDVLGSLSKAESVDPGQLLRPLNFLRLGVQGAISSLRWEGIPQHAAPS